MDQILADLIQSSRTSSTYGETKNKHTRLPLGNHMMRSLGEHVHTVNRKIKKFTSKKKVLRIKTGLKWLRRKPNV